MHQSRITMEEKHNDLTEIITQVLNEMKSEQGENFDINKVNLAELERRTGITRARLRRIKEDGFVDRPHGLSGKKAKTTVMTGYTGVIDDLLRKGVTNSSVCYARLKEQGFTGGLTTVKNYISAHKDLVPSKRELVARQGNRGRRYHNGPGEAYQMDWGFVEVEDTTGRTYKVACFAMICHCCGQRYVEFFPNARQENLFIGMLHAFYRMGIPRYILTDNMKSVVIKRDDQGHPIWQRDYEIFMGNIGFETKLCKPRHPFTKGAVERLIRFVKDNFLAGRIFTEITDLNYDGLIMTKLDTTTRSSIALSILAMNVSKIQATFLHSFEESTIIREIHEYLTGYFKEHLSVTIMKLSKYIGLPLWPGYEQNKHYEFLATC